MGQIPGIVAINRDSWLKNREWFRTVADTLPLMVWLTDVSGSCLWCSRPCLQFTGRTLEQITGGGWLHAVHPDDRFALLAAYQDAVQNGAEFNAEFRVCHSDGQYRWVVSHGGAIAYEGTCAYIGYAIDIHERKLVAAQLRESEDLFRYAFEDAPVGLALQTEQGQYVQVNRALCSMLGYTQEELLRFRFHDVTHPDDLEQSVRDLHALVSGQQEAMTLQKRYIRKDGRTVWVQVNVSVLRDSAGGFKHFIVQVQDISAQKEAERRLLAQHAVTKMLGESATIATLGRITARVLKQLCDYADCQVGVLWLVEGEPPALKVADFWSKPGVSVRAFRQACFARTFPLGAPLPGQTWQEAAPIWVRDVTRDPLFMRGDQAVADGLRGAAAFPILLNNAVVGVLELFSIEARDPTPGTIDLLQGIGSQLGQFVERVRAEEEVRKGKIMSVMGSLIASVAHEVRNPLFGMSATLDAFEARFGRDKKLLQYATVFRAEMEHLSDLMEELLEYGKPMRLDLNAASIGDVMEEAVRCCAPLADKLQVRLRVHVEKPPAQVQVDRRRLLLVFRNLLENAIQHSVRGSVVTVHAKRARENGNVWVDCRVLDRGPGFSPNDLPQIFEPFFTRRRGGTGLGLAIVRRIVQEHGGVILAENRRGGGAEVTVRIPTPSGGQLDHGGTI